MSKDVKVSIIIPVFNAEKYLRECLDSIIKQTFRNLEIILVNDRSTDKSQKIIDEYSKLDNRIEVVKHNDNKGLFCARITGVEMAKGDYICFVDADDTISIDWVRLLIKNAIESDADICIGNTVNVDENRWKYYYNNSINFTKFKKALIGENTLGEFFKQEGSCFHWQTIWNKIYKKSLWDKALPILKKQTRHLVMTEDILFSVVLFYLAQKTIFRDIDCYFYYRHHEASTGEHKSESKFIKNITDIATVFNFLEYFFNSIEKGQKWIQPLLKLKDKYYRIWCHAYIEEFGDRNNIKHLMLDLFKKTKIEDIYKYDFYTYQCTTEWNANYENIKAMIYDSKCSIISFDIFDTLILRPFWEPSDIFVLMAKPAEKIIGISSGTQFRNMRKNAENVARNKASKERPMREDISISEIYDQFGEIYRIDKAKCQQLMRLELSLEKKYCQRRESGVELLEMCKALNKRIILTSDMYLDKNFINELLSGLGIEGYEEIFVSSDVGALKGTTNLYKYVCNYLGIEPRFLLHIGDNWNSDIISAGEIGINTLFFAKPTEIFSKKIANIPVGDCMMAFSDKNANIPRLHEALKEFSVRSILAIVANKFFDRPNYSFQKESDFNGDAFFIGYYILGSFVLGIAKWIQDIALLCNYEKVIFLARDGYLIQDAFEKLCRKDERFSKIQSQYFYASRKALMPYSMLNKMDFYSIANYVNINCHSPESINHLMQDVLLPLTKERKQEYRNRGINFEKNFSNIDEFYKYINALVEISYDEQVYNNKKESVRQYYKKNFEGNVAIFDVGYSGKLPQIINQLCEKEVDAFFIHDSAGASQIAVENGFKIHKYLDFTPAVSGVVMEYFLSSLEGSCIGYKSENNQVLPIIEKVNHCYDKEIALTTMQQGCLSFIEDIITIFGECLEQFNFRNMEIASPMLYYLAKSKEFDTYMFDYVELEDELFGRQTAISFLYIYKYYLQKNKQIDDMGNSLEHIQIIEKYMPPKQASRLQKALYYFLFDRKTFKNKLKALREKKRKQ